MKIAVGILFVLVIVELILLLRVTRLRKQEKTQYQEADRMLTEYIAKNLDMEKKLSEMGQDYKKQQDMEAEIRKIQEQSRLLKHDMKNHTLVMLSYLEEGRVEEAQRYAGEILDKLNKMYTYVNVGNSLLNYVINHKLSKAKELGIEIKAEIENLSFDYIDSIDFSALLNNILDNAMEGALVSREKKLEVKSSHQKGFDRITVKNSIDTSVLERNPDFDSTKEEAGHGYGMKQIRSITKKQDGILDIYEKNGMFVVSVMFATVHTALLFNQ